MELSTGLLAPRVVRHDRSGAQVALVATTATLLGGDLLKLAVEVGPQLRLDLHDVAGTVAYHGRGLGCRVDVTLTVHTGAILFWAGQPVVVADGAHLARTLCADVADGGRLLLHDRVALGRAGEPGGSLRCHTSLVYAGQPALVEDLDLSSPLVGPGMLGSARVIDSVTAVGWRPAHVPAVSHLSLEAPGALARALLAAAHESSLPSLWTRWAGEVGER